MKLLKLIWNNLTCGIIYLLNSMKWQNIEYLPTGIDMPILFVKWKGKVPYDYYLANTLQDAIENREYAMRNTYTHWIYANPPQ